MALFFIATVLIFLTALTVLRLRFTIVIIMTLHLFMIVIIMTLHLFIIAATILLFVLL